jgi:coenzyme F420-reducing hydrogenase beta subunit
MPKLAKYNDCTGCGACSTRCGHDALHMDSDSIGVVIPKVNISKCVECGACSRACPALTSVPSSYPISCWAAWTANQEQRKVSASGGIAATIYKYAYKKGILVFGAVQKDDWTVEIIRAESLQDLQQFQNSKYTYSSATNAYRAVRNALRNNNEVLFVGLPCQVAAMRHMFGYAEGLILIDIVCHGNTPTEYLKQHINLISEDLGKQPAKMSFRAPEKGTSNYFFTLYDKNGDIIYSKRSMHGDTYNIGFHRAISYRESCYHCPYAKSERVSDITLGDYHGLGTMQPCDYSAENVSVILANTKKGKAVIETLIADGSLVAEQRPVDEPINGDTQLQHPTRKSIQRLDFEKFIRKTDCNFEKTMYRVLQRQKNHEYRKRIMSIPRRVVSKIYRIIVK